MSFKKNILAIAHRGFSAKYPENTMLAFKKGMEAGASGFECDLRLTADRRVVVFHDDDLKRLCGKKGTVEQSTYRDLQELRVLKSDEKIPLLEDLLDGFHTTRMNLEIKPTLREPSELVEEVLRILTKKRPSGEILFSSFQPEVLRCLRIMDPKKQMGRIGALVEDQDFDLIPQLTKELEADTWNLPMQAVSKPTAWMKENPRPIWLWTLDKPKEWQKALDSSIPVEGIICNRVDELVNFLKN